MSYNEKLVVRVPMKPSPSAIYNNLTLSQGNLLYSHMRQACAISPSAPSSGKATLARRVESQHTDFIHIIRAISYQDATYIVIGTEAGFQIWDKQAMHLLSVWALPESEQSATSTSSAFIRGAAMLVAADGTANLCLGSSSGKLYVVEISQDGRFKPPVSFTHHRSPITCIGSEHQSRQGKQTSAPTAQLVTCDESGQVMVWEGAGTSSYSVVKTLGSSNVPVTSVAVRGGYVVAARLDGCIQLYSLASGSLHAEITTHSRFLTAMDIHPTKDLVATAAEDGTINVWSLPIDLQKATNLLSSLWMHATCTGVCFCGPTFDDVAVAAYDTDELQIYKPSKPT